MWDRVFNVTMLNLGPGVEIAVNCPDEDDERELAAILTAFDRHYPNGNSPLQKKHWRDYGEDFCFFIDGATVTCGTKSEAEDPDFPGILCTFYGECQCEIPDENFEAIIGR